MKCLKAILIFGLPIMLFGCSSMSTAVRQKSYLSARSIAPLKIPPGIASSSFHNQFPVSDRYYPESEKDVSLVPPGLY